MKLDINIIVANKIIPPNFNEIKKTTKFIITNN